GNFTFPNLAFGNSTVTPSLACYAFVPSSVSVSSPTNINFSVATVNVAGRVTDGTTGIGLGDVAVQAVNATTNNIVKTDPNGNYTFKNLAGTYTIMPVPPQNETNVFNPARRTLTVGSALRSVDFRKEP